MGSLRAWPLLPSSPDCRLVQARLSGSGVAKRRSVSVTVRLLLLIGALWSAILLFVAPAPAWSAPGLCVGPVCADAFTRSAKHVFQLKMRLSDQRGHHERITVDCRDGRISPAVGPVERGYGSAVARRACRLVGQAPA